MAARYYPSPSSDVPSKLSQENYPPPKATTFSMRELIHDLENSEDYHDQIVPDGHRSFPEHLAEYGKVDQFPSLISRRAFPALVYRTRGSSHQSKRYFTNVQSSSQGDQRSLGQEPCDRFNFYGKREIAYLSSTGDRRLRTGSGRKGAIYFPHQSTGPRSEKV